MQSRSLILADFLSSATPSVENNATQDMLLRVPAVDTYQAPGIAAGTRSDQDWPWNFESEASQM
jgi:hypothetical protein